MKIVIVIKIESSLESMLVLNFRICLFIFEVGCLKMYFYYRLEDYLDIFLIVIY